MSNHLNNIALSEDKPQIYVACLASYNNAISYGEWIDATQEVEDIKAQIKQLLVKSPMPNAEEFAIHDCRGFGSVHIEQDESIEEVQEKALFIVEHGELGAEVLNYYDGRLEDAKKVLAEYYENEYKSELDYAIHLFDELYLHDIPKHAQWYIDYEKFERDIFNNDYFSLDVNGRCHVFRQY
ncbi:MAG TPA: antirestriction protein ArdA [Gammaproteobacteria bacterium]|nr:antirestriction protein ArdA [Gammaproteobacteria bacterium]